jgi:hypothetical protein
MSGLRVYFFIENLKNGAWVVGSSTDVDDYGRGSIDRAGFVGYAEAEAHAIGELKRLMRGGRDGKRK